MARGRVATAAARNAQLLELRKAGFTYEAIGAVVGISRQAAHKAITRALRELAIHTAEDAAEICTLELLRLDALLSGVWTHAMGGNLGAVDRALRIAERRAKITGIRRPHEGPHKHGWRRSGVRGAGRVCRAAGSRQRRGMAGEMDKVSFGNANPEPRAFEHNPRSHILQGLLHPQLHKLAVAYRIYLENMVGPPGLEPGTCRL